MQTLGETLRGYREQQGLLLREVAAQLAIDPSLLSKIERGDKKPTREHIIKLAGIYNADQNELVTVFLSDRILSDLNDDELSLEALKLAEEHVKYRIKNQPKP